MRHKGRYILLISLGFLIFCGFFFIPARAAEIYGWEYYNSSDYESKIKFQTDAVYIDTDQGGVCPFGIWVYGRNSFGEGWWSTRVLIKIFVMAQYETTYIEPIQNTVIYWSAAPDGFIKWQGDYNYNPSTQGTWQWTVGLTYKYYTFSAAYSTSGVGTSWAPKNEVVEYNDESYRYIGWVYSRRSGEPQAFHALLKLHVVNEIAKQWAEGVYVNIPGFLEFNSKILNIRVWLKFYYQWELFGWHTDKTVNHILGDGEVLSPPGGGTDLNYIPLVVGTAGPVDW